MQEKENKWLSIAKKAAIKAGAEILKVYEKDFKVSYKKDDSPLTIADQRANDIIEKFLSETNIPILSEEGKQIDFNERKNWNLLWIVDPIDGTKEFIKRNGEFTVNIALIKDGAPIIGVIYVPVSRCLYFASHTGTYKEHNGEKNKLPMIKKQRNFRVVRSRSHLSLETENYINKLRKEKGEIDLVSMGSSLKICLVAEGFADVYPRFAPTMEWDTAAGHAIAKYAGKNLIDLETNSEMIYNRPILKNNWFIVK